MEKQYLFVGEKRSRTAIRMAVDWKSGRLAAKTLFQALSNAGIQPDKQLYVNLFKESYPQNEVDWQALRNIRAAQRMGLVIVGMGRLVQREMRKADIPHLELTHPAARGAIRATAVY